jgi:O-antigen biosynthesis protein
MGIGVVKKLFRQRSKRQALYLRLLRGLHIDSGYQEWIDKWERYAPAEAGPAPSVPATIVVLGELSAADHAFWSGLDSADLQRQVIFAGDGKPSAIVAQALRDAVAEHLIFLRAADRLAQIAFHRLQAALAAKPEAALVYGDEDQIDRDGRRFAPWFKPDFGPDLFLSQNGFGRAVLFRAASLRVVQLPDAADLDTAVYHLALRVVLSSGRDPLHCPGILVHVGSDPAVTPKARVIYLKDPARRAAVEEFVAHAPSLSGVSIEGPDASGFMRLRHPVPAAPPLVSIVIPTRDRKDLLEQCIRSLDQTTSYRQIEIIVVDNDSHEPDTKAYFKALAERADVRIIAAPGAFNYSRLINLGASQAHGELLMALNNDIEAIEPGWLDELVGQVLRPGVGLAGALLLYPDRSVQHAGVVVGLGGVAGHIFAKSEAGNPGYAGRIKVAQDMSAVTGACHIMRRDLFQRLGGMDEAHLAVAYNDIDFCLRVREAGLRVIYTPFAPLLHRHSASRGSDVRPERLVSYTWERDYMRNRWAHLMWDDPFFNPNLSLSGKKGRLATPPRWRLYRKAD